MYDMLIKMAASVFLITLSDVIFRICTYLKFALQSSESEFRHCVHMKFYFKRSN